MSLVRRAAVVVTAALLTLSLTAAPSSAQKRVVRDRDGDGTTNIYRVRVTHAPLWIYVKTFGAPSRGIPHFLDVWIDTDAGNPGPEFVVTQWPSEDESQVVVFTSKRFGHFGTRRCKFSTGGYNLAQQTDWLSFRRYCLRDAHGVAPSRIRISLQGTDEVGPGEWVPAKRAWSRWIHRD